MSSRSVTRLALFAASAALTSLPPSALHAQDSSGLGGRWVGALDVQGTTLRLAFEFTQTDDGYTSRVFSIDQNNTEVPVESTTLDGPDVLITMPALPGQGEFLGTLSEDGQTIDGIWTQGGNSLPLVLEREEDPAH